MAGTDLEDLFHEHERDQMAEETYHAMGLPTPPPPPQTRTEQHRLRQAKRRRIILRRAVVIVLLAVFATGVVFFFHDHPLFNHLTHPLTSHTSQVSDYPGPGTGSVEFTVDPGESTAAIAAALVKSDVVASSGVFTQAVINAGAATSLQPGVFALKHHMTAADVVKILTDPSKATGMLVITSSSRSRDVFAQASALSGIPQADFQKLVDDKGQGILPAEAGGSFEGWLQPGTYDVKHLSSAQALVTQLVNKRVANLNALGVPTGATRERILTIASIIEGEVNKSQYYPKVARVIENRLAKGMSLGMDSVVAYGNNVAPSKLTTKMLTDPSNPYNSHIKKGLPPTPINQPSGEVIKAAMNPEAGDWLYFVTVNLQTGETKFTDNIAQFNQFSAEYQAWRKANPNY